MRKLIPFFAMIVALISAVSLYGQDHGHVGHQAPMAQMDDDHRQLVNLPPRMREHVLANMRDHLKSISDILAAMSTNQFLAAANIASTRLGMDSPAAQACNPARESNAPMMSTTETMEEQMARLVPGEMRSAGLEMHRAASAFAEEARNASRTGNAEAALVALSRVTQRCAACHST